MTRLLAVLAALDLAYRVGPARVPFTRAAVRASLGVSEVVA